MFYCSNEITISHNIRKINERDLREKLCECYTNCI